MNTSDVLLHGFSFSGYRSFIGPGQPLAPLGRVNLIAGQNNAGKSNILRFLRDYLSHAPVQPSPELDRPERVLPQNWQLRMQIFLAEFTLPDNARDNQQAKDLVGILSSAPGIKNDAGLAFSYKLGDGAQIVGSRQYGQWIFEPPDLDGVAQHLISHRINPMEALNLLLNQSYIGGEAIQFTSQLIQALSPNLGNLPEVRLIQAFRQIRPRTNTVEDELGLFDGVGLIERLQQLESPREIGSDRDELRARYEQINRFVRHILDDPSATIHIPFDASTIQIQRGSSVLPLESLGTGVHQVVMLAAAATLLSRTVVCLEEPEVHLHPLLQRRLVKYLASETDNQYFIATHSAHLLDFEAGQVFHLTYRETGSEVAAAGTPNQLAKVCADLGYRPSDLLQSNAVIWVEGPSDRIYVRHWIHQLAPELVEGIHYSIMFYGGGLLRHLTPDDADEPGLAITSHEKDVDDFIRLRRLNRHLAVIIDSDKTSPRKSINSTKQRVRRAFDTGDGPGLAWVTDCYTIENYVPRSLLEEAVAAVHPTWRLVADAGVWSNPLRFRGSAKRADKVAIARYVTANWNPDSLSLLRLDRRVSSLINLVRAANGHP